MTRLTDAMGEMVTGSTTAPRSIAAFAPTSASSMRLCAAAAGELNLHHAVWEVPERG